MFGRVKCYAGIDIGTETIKVAVVALRRDVAQVVKVAILPTPEGAVQDGAVVQPGQVAAVIKEALAQGDRLRVDGAVPLVPGNQLTVRTLSLPPMSPVELKEAARWEAGQYLPFPAEEASFDIVETSKGADVVEALFVGCREAVVDGLVAAVEAAGLRCLAVEAAPVVLPRLSGPPSRPASSAIGAVEAAASGERRAIAYLDLGACHANVGIFRDGLLRVNRTIPIGAKDMIASPAPRGGADKPDKSSQDVLDDLCREVQRSMDYYRAQHQWSPIDRIVLTGGGSLIPGIEAYLARALETRVCHPDLEWLRGRGVEFVEQTNMENLAVAGAALGAALREVDAQ